MILARLALTATISTSSITSTPPDLYRDLVEAVQVAEHLGVELDRCAADLDTARQASQAEPEVVEAWPGWGWAVVAGVALGAFVGGFSVASSGQR